MRASAVDPMFEVVSIRPSGFTLLVSGPSKPGTIHYGKGRPRWYIPSRELLAIGQLILLFERVHVVRLQIQGPEWLFFDTYGRTFYS